jgi:CBS domain-containing protein/sporulation protein YlmC with PRC-barrel domain
MIYFSQLVHQRVWDGYGSPIGKLQDVLIDATDKKMPPIVALILKDNNSSGINKLISAKQVTSLWPSVTLRVGIDKVIPYNPNGHELPLLDRVLDQQIVDIEGRRLVRVNDLQLARAGENFVLTGVDVSGMGLLRRLGLEKIGTSLQSLFNQSPGTAVIPWNLVASIEHDDPLRLSVSQSKMVKMAPADIAAIIDGLDRHTTSALLEGFNNVALADTLEESSPELQHAILASMNPERAADILEEMDPDEAADILAGFPDQEGEALLGLMEKDDATDVLALLQYPEDTAGGIMTNEYAYVPNNLSVGQALEYLRHSEDAIEDEVMYYVHIMDDGQRLHGIVTLRDLVMANPKSNISQWKVTENISVEPLTPQKDVAYLIAKYNLLSIPVIDPESQEMLGIVTVDDAIDTLLPTAWKKRLPRLF